ncbi:hypothetical protein [Microcystis phage MinS1]|nr:hypothetical protein [Microcystis phage MinS1]
MNAPAKMTALQQGTEQGIDWAICQAPLYGAINGYVRVPDDHPWAGKGYDDIDVDCPGGLTYARGGWIGFDTLHQDDLWEGGGRPHYCRAGECTCTVWTADMVADAARALAREVAEVAA